MKYIKAMFIGKQEMDGECIAVYQTEQDWLFGLDASVVESDEKGILTRRQLEKLGEDRSDTVFAVYSPIAKDTIIICDY